MSLAALRSNLAMMAQLAAAGRATARFGVVSTGHSPEYAVKVWLEPDHIETGYIPVLTPFVGNGWGLFSKPVAGDQVVVLFIDGDINSGVVVGGLYSDVDRPLNAPDRELWLQHQGGASIKFTNGNTIEINARAGMNVVGTVTADALISKTGATGTFTTPTGQIVSVQDGIITNIF